jgi:hypothetical protein
VLRKAVPGLSLALLCAACGSTSLPTTTTTATLAGWRSQADVPGISQLAPDLSGLDVTGTTDRRALVRSGNAIRAATFTFATEKDAREAEKRGAGDDYARALADAFRADAARKDGGVRLVVARPAEPGSDTVEVYLVRRGRILTVAELVSGHGFPPALREQALAAVSR